VARWWQPKERITASGLRITDLVVGEGDGASSGQTVSVKLSRNSGKMAPNLTAAMGRKPKPLLLSLGAGRVIKGWMRALMA